MSPELTAEFVYVGLLFVLFVVPRTLQRYRIPSAITALAFGATAGMGFGQLQDDRTVALLSTLGIVSLFLFAGLDVRVPELRKKASILIEHVVIGALGLAIVTVICVTVFDISVRSALLVALAIMTPSTGFILDSLGRWGLSEHERFWIRSKAIATELVALAVLFFVQQSESWTRFGLSALALIAMIALLPPLFRWFAKAVIPYAPHSEFGFLMMVGAACAVVTRSLGVYYLVGAFAVGMAAQEFRRTLPALASLRMLGAVESFASLFVPFYFFHAGLELRREDLLWSALALGLILIIVGIPFRLAQVVAHRSLRLGEPAKEGLRVGVPMMPTTVFTLVIAQILRDEFALPAWIFGGLIVYTLLNTLIPGLTMKSSQPGFEDELILAGESELVPPPPKPPASTPAPVAASAPPPAGDNASKLPGFVSPPKH